MDEVAKHLQVLGLKPGYSAEELEQAWQDRAEAWNPDNFDGNPKLRDQAREKLRHIQAAYEFLRPRLGGELGMGNGEWPAKTNTNAEGGMQNAETGTTASAGNHSAFWLTTVLLVLLLLSAAYLLIWGTRW